MATHYVVYLFERLQDGHEEGAQVFGRLDKALECANRLKQGVHPHTRDVRLFELGRELPLREETTEVPQPPVRTSRLVLADKPSEG